MTDAAEQDQTEEKAEKPSFRASLTEADKRLFVITIAGTTIGAVLTLVVVALAILAARLFVSMGGLGDAAAVFGATMGVYLLLGLAVSWVRRFLPARLRNRLGGSIRFHYVMIGTYGLLFLFGLLGYAAGVK